VVERDRDARARRKALVPHLDELYRLYQALHAARAQRGAIDFETTETRIVFGAERKIERIVPVERNDAHKIIEECMIAANVCAARFLARHKLPTLYRIHEGPKADKLSDLREFLGELGLSLGGGDKPQAGDYAHLLARIQDRPDNHLIQTVMLRSLSQARYSPDNIGHFGLAHAEYLHFTSPIRRYPDLLVHRAIRHQLQFTAQNGAGSATRRRSAAADSFGYSTTDMMSLGEHCSMTERRADDATRDAVDWLKCEYMMDKVAQEFDAIISSVTAFGIFVELKEIYVEGLVHVTALQNDYYRFDPAGHRLRGERTGRTYRLGDQLQVRLVRVDLDDRKLDFELAAADRGHTDERSGRLKKSGRSARARSTRRKSR
jgi:ribonuclease R